MNNINMLPNESPTIGSDDSTALKSDAVKGAATTTITTNTTATTKSNHNSTNISMQQQKELAEKLERALSTDDTKMKDEHIALSVVTIISDVDEVNSIGGLDNCNDYGDDNPAYGLDDRIKIEDNSVNSKEETTNGHDDVFDAKGSAPNSPVNIKIPDYTAYMPTARDAIEYNMDHKNRGIALIFNHESFDIRTLSKRNGTNKDSVDLREALEKLHFEVKDYDNLKLCEIENKIIEVSELDHSNSDCLMIIILSHGDNGCIYARDRSYELRKISRYFAAHNCPTLAGKPKLFFIQACQGKHLDPGTVLRKPEKSETDGDFSNASYKIPTHADFLFAYSTIPGFVAWRSPEGGSWFIQSLVQELKENALKNDILTLLTSVNRRVALEYESNVESSPTRDQQKQISCLTSMLTRILRFKEKTQQQKTEK